MTEQIENLENDIRNLNKWTVKQAVEWDAYRALRMHPNAKRSDLEGFIEHYKQEQEEQTECMLLEIRSMHAHLTEYPDLWCKAMVEILTYTKHNCVKAFETYGQHTEFYHSGYSYCLEAMNKVLEQEQK